MNVPRFHKEKQLYRFVRAFGFSEISVKMLRKKIHGMMILAYAEESLSQKQRNEHAIILHSPEKYSGQFGQAIAGITQMSSWPKILQMIQEEQQNNRLKVIVYPCAFLQFTLNHIKNTEKTSQESMFQSGLDVQLNDMFLLHQQIRI